MTKRQLLLRQVSVAQFAVWELHIYLDTHADDEKALEIYKRNVEKYEALKEKYEALYGPLSPGAGSAVAWLADPWPWEGGDDC